MEYLKFEAQCPLCNSQLDYIKVPRGIFGGGGTVCNDCKQQISYYYSPSEDNLVVRMRTLPIGRIEPDEVKFKSYTVEEE